MNYLIVKIMKSFRSYFLKEGFNVTGKDFPGWKFFFYVDNTMVNQ